MNLFFGFILVGNCRTGRRKMLICDDDAYSMSMIINAKNDMLIALATFLYILISPAHIDCEKWKYTFMYLPNWLLFVDLLILFPSIAHYHLHIRMPVQRLLIKTKKMKSEIFSSRCVSHSRTIATKIQPVPLIIVLLGSGSMELIFRGFAQVYSPWTVLGQKFYAQ